MGGCGTTTETCHRPRLSSFASPLAIRNEVRHLLLLKRAMKRFVSYRGNSAPLLQARFFGQLGKPFPVHFVFFVKCHASHQEQR